MQEQYPWIEYIQLETLPNEDLKIIASSLGLEAVKKLMCEFPGVTFTIPQNATLEARKEYVRKHYDGSKKSRVTLSKLCGLSENYIYRSLGNKK